MLDEPLAQLVEHLTFNQVVVGSIPTRLTKRKQGLGRLPGPFFMPQTPPRDTGGTISATNHKTSHAKTSLNELITGTYWGLLVSKLSHMATPKVNKRQIGCSINKKTMKS